MKLLILMFIFISCASKSIVLLPSSLLPYKEMSQVTKVPFRTKSLALKNVNDYRNEKNFGYGFTGVQYDKTPIRVGQESVPFFQNYITDSLEVRNIIVAADGELSLEVDIRELRVEEVIEKFQPEKAKCKANITFHVQSANKKWSGNYWTEFISPGDLSDGSERLAPTLASCMNEIIEKLITDNEFLKMLK